MAQDGSAVMALFRAMPAVASDAMTGSLMTTSSATGSSGLPGSGRSRLRVIIRIVHEWRTSARSSQKTFTSSR